jgi:peptidoglycan hydrolase CwlO-like protein
MTKKFFSVLILFLIFIQTIFVDHSFAITAEERLEEVEKQLIAIANQIKQYEGDKTDLEKAILANDSSLKKVNDELAEVQRRLVAAELALEKALEGYDESLDNLAAVQQNIVNEQVKLGTTKNEIIKVKDDLFETQKNLNSAKDELQEKAVDMYINGVMSPATALFINLNDLSDFLAALGYASAIVNTAYEIIESLNSFESLSETQTEFLSEREEEREEIISSLQVEEEKKNQISIEALLVEQHQIS